MKLDKQQAQISEAPSTPIVWARIAESSTPERLAAVVETLLPPDSVSLLIGEPGVGKSRLAREAAAALGDRLSESVSLIPLLQPEEAADDPATASRLSEMLTGAMPFDRLGRLDGGEPEELGPGLDERIERESQHGAPLLLAHGLDRYSPLATSMLDELVRSHRVRIVGTAMRLSGGAAHVARDPRVNRIPVPPLTVDESRCFIEHLLGAEYVEPHTLRRWYRVTAGNALSLTLLALTLERQGLVGRRRSVVYELPGAETVPAELGEFLGSTCSEEELRTLEMIAHAQPISENTFVRLLDPACVASLRDRGLLVMGSKQSGRFELGIRHQLLSAAVRERMSPARVMEVSNRLFEALQEEAGAGDPRDSPRLFFRMVAMGLDSDRRLPLHWLWDALESRNSGYDERARLRVALAIASHPDASTAQLTKAALEAVRLARMIGDRTRPAEAIEHVREAVERTRRSLGPTPILHVKLQVALAEHFELDREDAAAAEEVVEELEREFAAFDGAVRAAVQSARVMLLARTGRLGAAAAAAPDSEVFDSMPIEWERTPARAVSSLILSQRGRYDSAIRLADYAGSFAEMGEQPQVDNAKLLRFCGFFASWAAGAVEAARLALQEFADSSFDDLHQPGLVETCEALLSVADGKWRRAAQQAERLRARLIQHDRHGLMGLVDAVLALALAALGEREASRRSIRFAENRQAGLSQILAGCVRLLTLRARQWNGDEGVAALSLQLASWAGSEGLDSVELRALHLHAIEAGEEARAYRARIRTLAAAVEPPLSAVLLAHCEELLQGRSSWDSPPARRLTEFGIWMPLPRTDVLSAREREIAMLASLGYSSRWIAEQHRLSVRTVETHLYKVFSKLGVSGRDELRLWFRREPAAHSEAPRRDRPTTYGTGANRG